MEREITSRDNPLVKQYVLLASSRRARHEQGLFVTEGVKLTCEAFDAGYAPTHIFTTEEAFLQYEDDVQRVALECESFLKISPSVAEKLAQTVSPQGVFGVFSMLDNEKQPATISKEGCYLLLSSLQDPGNLGTILRTAAAMGIAGVFVSADCPDVFSPKVLRAAMGGVFKIPLYRMQEPADTIALLKENQICIYAAVLAPDAVDARKAALGKGCAIVIGNEGNGLDCSLLALCDKKVRLPMKAGTESLNAAVAAGILLWEMAKADL